MSATILAFPEKRIAPRARPTSVDDLADDQRALVVSYKRGWFSVSIRPATTPTERSTKRNFRLRHQAFDLTRRFASAYPHRFPLILDETPPQTRWFIDDFGGAA